jgi:hypothetical protein
LLEERLGALETRLRGGDETAWPEYLATIQALTSALTHVAPGAGGRLVSTRELSKLMGVSSKTILRRKAKGQIGGAVELGRRGRAAVRWDVGAAVRS